MLLDSELRWLLCRREGQRISRTIACSQGTIARADKRWQLKRFYSNLAVCVLDEQLESAEEILLRRGCKPEVVRSASDVETTLVSPFASHVFHHGRRDVASVTDRPGQPTLINRFIDLLLLIKKVFFIDIILFNIY